MVLSIRMILVSDVAATANPKRVTCQLQGLGGECQNHRGFPAVIFVSCTCTALLTQLFVVSNDAASTSR